MKNGLVFVLFLVLRFSVFSETGYRGIAWYTPQSKVVDILQLKNKSKAIKLSGNNIYTKKPTVFGKK